MIKFREYKLSYCVDVPTRPTNCNSIPHVQGTRGNSSM